MWRIWRLWRSTPLHFGLHNLHNLQNLHNLHNLPNLLYSLNGTGANVMKKSTSAPHATTRRDAGSGRCASSTEG